MQEEQNNLLDQALKYARQGLYVFPVQPSGKAPITPHGFKDSTIDEKQIVAWWNETPGANIGIATGSEYSNLLVVDVDIDKKNKISGWKTYHELVRHYGKMPETWKAKTGRGGTHFYYKLDKEIVKSSVSALGDGLDIRAEGGYIVAPPSRHPNGKYYTWESQPDKELTPAPKGLIKAIRDTESTRNKEMAPLEGAKMPEEGEVFTAGTRNDRMFRLGIGPRKAGAGREAISTLLQIQNEKFCSPPLKEKELNKIIENIMDYDILEQPKQKIKKKYSTKLKPLSEVEKKKVAWLINGYIPKYNITVMGGEGGSGKTSFWCNLAAAISTGNLSVLEKHLNLTFTNKPKGKVVFFSSEDSAEYVLAERLEKNGADLENILHVSYEEERFEDIKFMEDYLDEVIEANRPDLVIFDPLQGFLSHDTIMGSRNHMRAELNAVQVICAKYKTTALIVMHTNKGRENAGRNRLADSSDIWDIARSVLILGFDEETGYRYVSHEKSNYGQQGSTVMFSIDDGRIKAEGISNKKDRDFVRRRNHEGREAPARDAAVLALREYLMKNGGEVPTAELEEALKSNGHSLSAIKKAKQFLKDEGLESRKKEGEGGKYYTAFYNSPV